MIVRILDTKNLGKAAAEAAKKFLNLQVSIVCSATCSLIFFDVRTKNKHWYFEK